MKKKALSQKQRIIVAFLYVVIIAVVYGCINGGVDDLLRQSGSTSLWFFSGIFLVILGKYVAEPYFSAPTDTFTNCLSLILVLTSVTDKNEVIGYWWMLVGAILLFILSLIHIIFKESNDKFKKITFFILKTIGSSQVVFSVVYILSAFSYFADNIIMLIAAMTLWICIVPIDMMSYAISWVCDLFALTKSKNTGSVIGLAVKNAEEEQYTVSVKKDEKNEKLLGKEKNKLFAIKTDADLYRIGIETKRMNLIDSTWVSLLLLEAPKYDFTVKGLQDFGIEVITNEDVGTTHIIKMSVLDTEKKQLIQESEIYQKRDKLIGFILSESNVNAIKVQLCNKDEQRIKEGTIIETKVLGKTVLYQVINGITKNETNHSDSDTGYMCVLGRKLGQYVKEKNDLLSVNWTPNMYEPVYLCDVNENVDFQEIADTAIGRLPGSDMKIPIKDINALVTHNTAILGILGVGKSCLTFEVIKKIVESGKKVVCFDITNQYASEKGLIRYLDKNLIATGFQQGHLDKLKDSAKKTGDKNNPDEWGNVKLYKELVHSCINWFLDNDEKRVLIINPDDHEVKRAAPGFTITTHVDVSLVEKVQIFSEQILDKCMELGQTEEARCCVVYEEAHSLTPEFNSVVVKEDNSHANGTAKVILQGRKFGLGCIVVTQRTANVTKSILNQCNTIFALRVFDDTGKTFLENYIGKEYSDTLPALEERHAIAIGKGIGLKQPVIIQLNDMKYVINKTEESRACEVNVSEGM